MSKDSAAAPMHGVVHRLIEIPVCTMETPRDFGEKHNQFHAIIRRWHDIHGFDKGQDYTTLWNRINAKPCKRCEKTGKKVR